MAGFYMLAGTVTTDLTLDKLSQALHAHALVASTQGDELRLTSQVENPAKLALRSGFAHEFIAVGHAREQQPLMSECERLSSVLQSLQIAHELEIYDVKNELIRQLGFSLSD